MKKCFLIFVILLTSISFAQKEFNIKHYQQFKSYSKEELKKLLPYERKLLQAEILALYGYEFKEPYLQKYFQKQIWYKKVISQFPPLIPSDSVNYYLLEELNQDSDNTVFENIKSLIPKTERPKREYFSYCFEKSKYKSIAKRPFSLATSNNCYRTIFFQPRFELPSPPDDFERFFDVENFSWDDFIFFKKANDVKGIIFRAEYDTNNKPIMFAEVGVDPGLNLGEVVSENYVDDLGRIILHYNKMCNDGKITQLAKIYTYKDNEIIKEVMLLETDDSLFVQVTTKEIYFETGFRKKDHAGK
ncbi:MAG: YARHG domain-containing protein [Bacteroidetes bacterium]|nr:YARHG domain-containing protein [Bacteroidota bacterium]MBU2583800.1 YARHG domain-containing protein [Bacteroidota bacterium]